MTEEAEKKKTLDVTGLWEARSLLAPERYENGNWDGDPKKTIVTIDGEGFGLEGGG